MPVVHQLFQARLVTDSFLSDVLLERVGQCQTQTTSEMSPDAILSRLLRQALPLCALLTVLLLRVVKGRQGDLANHVLLFGSCRADIRASRVFRMQVA